MRGIKPLTVFKHAAGVLLNGKPLWYRLGSVVVGMAPPVVWTVCFKQARRIPDSIRPEIHIHLLPPLNYFVCSIWGILFLTALSIPIARYVYYNSRRPVYAIAVLCFPTLLALSALAGRLPICDTLDVMAFVTYGALHFASPFMMGWWLWFFGAQGSAMTFGWCLGLQNLLGLFTHLVFPTAAPWFYDLYGADAAQPDYTYPGNPAGLIRVDRILGTHLYTHAFGKSPVVFGALPSLHAATCFCVSLFVVRYAKQYGIFFMFIYSFWMLWSTQYLHHHFAIDLLAGAIYASIIFTLFERFRLRRIDYIAQRDRLTNGFERLFFSMKDGDNDVAAAVQHASDIRLPFTDYLMSFFNRPAFLKTPPPEDGGYLPAPRRRFSIASSASDTSLNSFTDSSATLSVDEVANKV